MVAPVMNRQLLARIVVVATAVAVVPAMNASVAGASPVDDQRQKVEQITDELERLERESDILAEDYVTAIDEQKQLDAEVAGAEVRVEEKRGEVADLRGELSEVAVRAFADSGTDVLGPMFSDSGTYTDDLQRDQLARIALSTGTATTDELDEAVSDLEGEQAALADKREEASAKAEQVEDARVANDERKSEYETARAEAEAELGDLIRKEEERRARESYERMQRAAEEAAAAQAAAAAAAQAEAQQAAAAAAAEAQQAEAEEAASQQSQQASGGSSQQSQQTQQSSGGSSQQSGGGSNQSSGGSSQASSNVNALASARPQPAPAPAPAPAPEPEPEAAPEPAQIPQASSRAGTAVSAALSQLGVPWIFAMAEPGVGFDCSGLTSWAWGQAGVYLPHQSRAQYAMLPHVPQSAAQPGDLLFFYSPISHVSIYLGGGQQVHAPNSGTTVKTGTVSWGKVVGVGRPG